MRAVSTSLSWFILNFTERYIMTIPTVLLYSIPAIPIFGLACASQMKASKNLRLGSQKKTSVVADVELKKFLKSKDLQELEILKSENYSQNEYVESEGKIRLSPDTIDAVDAVSVALALHAGAQAVASRRAPEKTRMIQKLRYVEILIFWIAFCVLSFGLMSSSLVLSVAGYVCVFGVWLVNTRKGRIMKSVDQTAVDFVRASDYYSDVERKNVIKAFNAIRAKF